MPDNTRPAAAFTHDDAPVLRTAPLRSRLWRLIRGTARFEVNPFAVARVWLAKKRLRRKLQFIDQTRVLRPGDAAYRDYLTTQLGHLRSLRALYPDVSWKHALVLPKVADIFASRAVPLSGVRALCIGCRTGSELTAFEQLGVGKVQGIDLYTTDPARVELMDMHRLTYADNSFDIIYSADSIEHAYDLQTVLGEIVRVARPGAIVVILTPVQFERNVRHPSDIETPENLHRMLGGAFRRSYHDEIMVTKRNQKYAITIFEIQKPDGRTEAN